MASGKIIGMFRLDHCSTPERAVEIVWNYVEENVSAGALENGGEIKPIAVFLPKQNLLVRPNRTWPSETPDPDLMELTTQDKICKFFSNQIYNRAYFYLNELKEIMATVNKPKDLPKKRVSRLATLAERYAYYTDDMKFDARFDCFCDEGDEMFGGVVTDIITDEEYKYPPMWVLVECIE